MAVEVFVNRVELALNLHLLLLKVRLVLLRLRKHICLDLELFEVLGVLTGAPIEHLVDVLERVDLVLESLVLLLN